MGRSHLSFVAIPFGSKDLEALTRRHERSPHPRVTQTELPDLGSPQLHRCAADWDGNVDVDARALGPLSRQLLPLSETMSAWWAGNR